MRAWDFKKKGFFCLSMNDLMYDNFITEKQIKILVDNFKFIQIPSVRTSLGHFSMMFMPKLDSIVDIVVKGTQDIKIEDNQK